SVVFERHVHTTANRRLGAGIGDFEVLDFPVFLVLEHDGIFHPPITVNHRLHSASVHVHGYGRTLGARAFGPQLSAPHTTAPQEDALCGMKYGGVDLIERSPSQTGGSPSVPVIALP